MGIKAQVSKIIFYFLQLTYNLTLLLLLHYQKDINNSSLEDLVKMTSAAETLDAISTPETLKLFKSIAVTNKSEDNSAPRKEANLTNRQHYLRITKLTKAGLITRKGEVYFLTSYGKIVYHTLTRIDTALSNYWRLKVIDSIEVATEGVTARGYTREEFNKIVDILIDNHKVKKVIKRSS